MLAYGQCDGQADVGTGRTPDRQLDGQGGVIMPSLQTMLHIACMGIKIRNGRFG